MLKKISIVMPYEINTKGITVWTQTRTECGKLNGLEEFPGGKIESRETPVQAAIREYKEEIGHLLRAEEIKLFSMHHHEYEDRNILLYIHTLEVTASSPSVSKLSEQKISWESAKNDVEKGLFPNANKEFLLLFIKHLQKQLGV